MACSDNLSRTLVSIAISKNNKLLKGDFNTKVDSDNQKNENFVGAHVIRRNNEQK